MDGATPQVSVVMPCFNSARFVATSAASALGQTLGDLELVVVDNGSTDDTVRVVESISDARVRVLHETNRGVSAARNHGIRAARGRYIAFLDSDDTWEPHCLAELHAALATRDDAVLAYCGWQNLGIPGGRGEPFVPPEYEGPDKIPVLLAGCRWPIHAALTLREAIERAGGFDERYTHAEDFALWLRVCAQGAIVRVPQVLAYYHHHGSGQATQLRGRAALMHLQAQRDFLADNPQLAARLGTAKVRELTLGKLLQRGYECYWRRDLPAARAIFRAVMRARYGSARDWAHMMPSALPLGLHAALLRFADTLRGPKGESN